MAPVWLRRSVSGLASASLALGVLSACGSSAAARNDGDQRVAAVYRAVILAVADGQKGDAHLPVVFVAPRPDAKTIPITVQASVVGGLADQVSVRFVDNDKEAIDGTVDGAPVKEGVLLRLGPVAAGDPVEVTADRYRTITDQQLVTLSARSNGEEWAAQVISEGPLTTRG
jgi:hypothetical protein